MLPTLSEPAEDDGDDLSPAEIRPLGEYVFLIRQDEIVRVVNFETGRFYALDALGSVMLALAREHGPDEAARRIAAACNVPVERVRNDVAHLLRSLESKGIRIASPARRIRPAALCGSFAAPFLKLAHGVSGLIRAPFCLAAAVARRITGHPAPAVRLPSRFALHLLFLFNWLSLRVFGWARTLEFSRGLTSRMKPKPHPPTDELLMQLDALVRGVACRSFPFAMECKERAITAYQVLRGRYGIETRIVLGVQRHPFGGHAWIECGGRILTDYPDHCATFLAVASFE